MLEEWERLSTLPSSDNSGVVRSVPIAPEPLMPGAVAVDGPDSEMLGRVHTGTSQQENQADLVMASAVDNAEVVVTQALYP